MEAGVEADSEAIVGGVTVAGAVVARAMEEGRGSVV